MNKIQAFSRGFRILLTLFFIAVPIMTILFWLDAPIAVGIDTKFTMAITFQPTEVMTMFETKTSGEIFHELSGTEKAIGFLIHLIPMLITLLFLYFLIQLFKLYEKNIIFSIENAICYRNLGLTLLASQIINPFYQAIMTYAMTQQLPLEQQRIVISIADYNMSLLGVAIIIILISWIMAEACKLKEEHDFTV